MVKSGELFDDFAQQYDQFRPSYPDEIVYDLIRFTGLQAETKVLEVGAGTGQLTQSLVKSKAAITAIEPGKHLAAILKNKVKYDRLKVCEVKLEDLYSTDLYDVIISAQAFHWIDFSTGLDMVHKMTLPNGTLGLLWRIDQSENTEFYQETQPIYGRYYQEKNIGKSIEQYVSDFISTVKNRDDFSIQVNKSYKVIENYSAEEYIGLLMTYSGVISLPDETRLEFLNEIKSVILNLGGYIERIFELVLLVVDKK